MEGIKIKLKYNILIAAILLILLCFNRLSINLSSISTNTESKNVIKVGIYEYEPYVYVEKMVK